MGGTGGKHKEREESSEREIVLAGEGISSIFCNNFMPYSSYLMFDLLCMQLGKFPC